MPRPSVPCIRRVPAALTRAVSQIAHGNGLEIKRRRRNTDLLAWAASDGTLQPQEGAADLVTHGGLALLVRDGHRGGSGVVAAGATAAVEETAGTAGRGCGDRRTTTAGAEETSSRLGGGGGCEGSGTATAGAKEAVASSGGGGVAAGKHFGRCVDCVDCVKLLLFAQ